MANSFSYAAKYAPELDKMIEQEAKTGFLKDNAMGAMFVGANTVKLPRATMIGLGNYNRATGYPAGDTTLTHDTYTLSQERGRQLFIDAQDADESGVPDLAGKLMGEYNRLHVIPEIDAYTLSKIRGVAKTNSHAKTYAEATAVSDLLETINDVEAAMGYDSSTSVISFVDPAMYAILMTSSELERMITISDFKQGDISFKVKTVNGCAIIPVAANRMKTQFDFYAGSSSSAGGFTPNASAKQIHAIVMPKDGASLVEKVNKSDLHGLGEDINRDGYVINFRIYYDLFVKESRKNTIYSIEVTA